MGSLHLVGGEKGGVGKSWLSRLMAHALGDGGEFVLVDADQSNPTLANFYREAIQIPFSDHPKLEDISDQVFDYAIQTTVIVNAPGQPVKLTERQVEGLKLLDKPEGKLALDIIKYNPGKIDDCLQSQASILKDTIALPTLGKVEYGACVLWLVPIEQRRFSP